MASNDPEFETSGLLFFLLDLIGPDRYPRSMQRCSASMKIRSRRRIDSIRRRRSPGVGLNGTGSEHDGRPHRSLLWYEPQHQDWRGTREDRSWPFS